jgi:glycosyltransferase involved in cell wall biosynthesis
MNPLVSILIPAYNAEKWIQETIKSALNQTYSNVEIIVVNDGSRDNTLTILKRFESVRVKVVDQKNAGSAAARNTALTHSQGEYVQWLDHDDLLAANKIAEQMKQVQKIGDDRRLFSGTFSTFFFCPERATTNIGPLWKDLSPLEYFYTKFEHDQWLHTTCWLVSRKLTELAGPWLDLRSPDDDGEYFCRVVAASNGLIFVPTATSYWRVGNSTSFSYSRQNSVNSLQTMLESTSRCIAHFRALEDSERSRKACVTFLRNRLIYYYPEQKEMLDQIYALARDLGGSLSKPPLLPHYEFVRKLVGWRWAKRVQDFIPTAKQNLLRSIDKSIYNRSRDMAGHPGSSLTGMISPSAGSQDGSLSHGILHDGVATRVAAAHAERQGLVSLPPINPPETPLVSILIPAYNAESWIEETIRSALDQTWPNKEIIIVDDGSTDQTFGIANQFASATVLVARQANLGASAARNKAFSLCRGDYIQWLDADDLLAPDKIEKQLGALNRCRSRRTILSGAWGTLFYRTGKARFSPSPLWTDLSPLEWLTRKLGQNCHMQTGNWLVSRELTQAAGPWDTRLMGDDDGEYFCRVKLQSDGIIFIPESKSYYRSTNFNTLSNAASSRKGQDALFLSIQLHIQYLLSLENNERTRAACIRHLQKFMFDFSPERPDLVQKMENLARELGGQLHRPQVSPKFAWIETLFGWRFAKQAQISIPRLKLYLNRYWDKVMFELGKPFHNESH